MKENRGMLKSSRQGGKMITFSFGSPQGTRQERSLPNNRTLAIFAPAQTIFGDGRLPYPDFDLLKDR
jgi:hypothetical protein